MYNQPPGRNPTFQNRNPNSYGGQQGGPQYAQNAYQPKQQSYPPQQGYAQDQYQQPQQQYQPPQQYNPPPQQYNPPPQQYNPPPQQYNAPPQNEPVKEERKPRSDTVLSPNALPASEVTFRDKASVWWANDGPKWIWLSLWFLANVAVVVERYVHYKFVFRNGDATKLFIGEGLPIARASAAGIKLNCALMLIMVLRNFLSWVRTTVVGSFIPTDKNIIFHRYIAWVIAFYTWVHVMAHYFNYYVQATLDDTNFRLLYNLNADVDATQRTVYQLALTRIAGATGYVATMLQVLMYTSAIRFVRSPMFNVFWFTHHLFFPFYIVLSCHSINSIFEPPTFWAWVIGPLVFYLIERIVRIYRGNQDTILQLAIAHPSRVIELQMKKAAFKYKPGQYLFLNCPYIARQEWHPFTISSAPEEEFVSVHIRIVGDWTGELWAFLNPGKKLGVVQENVVSAPDGSPIFRIDGPFGAASEEVFDYNAVMLVAGGIGVTPFSSILKSINFKLKMHNQTAIEKVYFYWISRDKNAFEWINEILSALEQDNPRNFLEISTYLTGQLSVDEIRNVIYGLDQETDQITGLQSPTYFGRPNWDMIFCEKAEKHRGRTVGVFFCGPAVLSKQLYKMATKYTDAKTLTKFVYHKENF